MMRFYKGSVSYSDLLEMPIRVRNELYLNAIKIAKEEQKVLKEGTGSGGI